MVEVDSERMFVNTCIEPILNTTDDSSINYKYLRENRQNMAPVLTHQLRKVYSSSGKSPPKVALSSLDLHVPVSLTSRKQIFRLTLHFSNLAYFSISTAKFLGYWAKMVLAR